MTFNEFKKKNGFSSYKQLATEILKQNPSLGKDIPEDQLRNQLGNIDLNRHTWWRNPKKGKRVIPVLCRFLDISQIELERFFSADESHGFVIPFFEPPLHLDFDNDSFRLPPGLPILERDLSSVYPNYWETDNHIGVSLYIRYLEYCQWKTIQVSDVESHNKVVDSKRYVVLFDQEFRFEQIQEVLTDTKHQWLFIHDQPMKVDQIVNDEMNLFGDQSPYQSVHDNSKSDSQWNHIVLTPSSGWKRDMVRWLNDMLVLSKEYESFEPIDIETNLEWIDNFESLLQYLALLCEFGSKDLSFEKSCKELIKQRMPFEMRHNSSDVSKAFELCKRLINGCLSNELSLYQTEEVWKKVLLSVDKEELQVLVSHERYDAIHECTRPIDWEEVDKYHLLIHQSDLLLFPHLLADSLIWLTVANRFKQFIASKDKLPIEVNRAISDIAELLLHPDFVEQTLWFMFEELVAKQDKKDTQLKTNPVQWLFTLIHYLKYDSSSPTYQLIIEGIVQVVGRFLFEYPRQTFLKQDFLNQLWTVQHSFILYPEWDEHRVASRPLAISINDSVVRDMERIFPKHETWMFSLWMISKNILEDKRLLSSRFMPWKETDNESASHFHLEQLKHIVLLEYRRHESYFLVYQRLLPFMKSIWTRYLTEKNLSYQDIRLYLKLVLDWKETKELPADTKALLFEHHFDAQLLQLVVEHYSIDIEKFYPYLWKCWFETPNKMPAELIPRNQRINEDSALGNLWKRMPIKYLPLERRFLKRYFTVLDWYCFLDEDSWIDLYTRLKPLLEEKSLFVSDITNDMWGATELIRYMPFDIALSMAKFDNWHIQNLWKYQPEECMKHLETFRLEGFVDDSTIEDVTAGIGILLWSWCEGRNDKILSDNLKNRQDRLLELMQDWIENKNAPIEEMRVEGALNHMLFVHRTNWKRVWDLKQQLLQRIEDSAGTN